MLRKLMILADGERMLRGLFVVKSVLCFYMFVFVQVCVGLLKMIRPIKVLLASLY